MVMYGGSEQEGRRVKKTRSRIGGRTLGHLRGRPRGECESGQLLVDGGWAPVAGRVGSQWPTGALAGGRRPRTGRG